MSARDRLESAIDTATAPWVHTPMGYMLSLARAGRIVRPRPTVGRILDRDTGLFYPGKVNGLAGDSGGGKSWTVLRAALDEAEGGRHTIWIDYEDTSETLSLRMAEIGFAEPLGDYLHHVSATGKASEGLDLLTALVAEFEPRMAVFDSAGEALAADGMDPNSDDEVARWFQALPRPISELGPAVVLIDHLVKDGDGGLWPIGSQRKRAAITGVQYVVRIISAFARGRSGRIRLICAKDRSGDYAQGDAVAEVTFDTRPDGGLLVGVWAAREERKAEDGGMRPTGLMQRVSRWLEVHGPDKSRRDIEGGHLGKASSVRRAIDVLVMEGFVTDRPGPHNARLHTSIQPYREGDEA